MRYLLGLILVLALILGISGTAFAVPILPAQDDQIVVFGEYNTLYAGLVIGAGYGISENFTLGGYYAPYYSEFGVYGNAKMGPVVADFEVCYRAYDNFLYAQASGLYTFDLGQFTLGVGGGADFNNLGWFSSFLKAGANLAVSDSASIYGSVSYYWSLGDLWYYQAGLSFGF